MNKIDKKQTKRILEFAMLNCKDNEIDEYVNGLNQVLEKIDKIKEIKVDNKDILITPTTNFNCYDDGRATKISEKQEILKNIPNKEGDYILVPMVIE